MDRRGCDAEEPYHVRLRRRASVQQREEVNKSIVNLDKGETAMDIRCRADLSEETAPAHSVPNHAQHPARRAKRARTLAKSHRICLATVAR